MAANSAAMDAIKRIKAFIPEGYRGDMPNLLPGTLDFFFKTNFMEAAVAYRPLELRPGREYTFSWWGKSWTNLRISIPELGQTRAEEIEKESMTYYAHKPEKIITLEAMGHFKNGMPCAVFWKDAWRRGIVVDVDSRIIGLVDHGTMMENVEERHIKPLIFANNPPIYNKAFVSAIQDSCVPSWDKNHGPDVTIATGLILNESPPFEVLIKGFEFRRAEEVADGEEPKKTPRPGSTPVLGNPMNELGNQIGAYIQGGTVVIERVHPNGAVAVFRRSSGPPSPYAQINLEVESSKFDGQPMNRVTDLKRIFAPGQQIKVNAIPVAYVPRDLLITNFVSVYDEAEKCIIRPGVITYVGKQDAVVLMRSLGEYVWTSKRAFPPSVARRKGSLVEAGVRVGTRVIIRAVLAESYLDLKVDVKWIAAAVEKLNDIHVDYGSSPDDVLWGVDVFQVDRDIDDYPLDDKSQLNMQNVRNLLLFERHESISNEAAATAIVDEATMSKTEDLLGDLDDAARSMAAAAIPLRPTVAADTPSTSTGVGGRPRTASNPENRPWWPSWVLPDDADADDEDDDGPSTSEAGRRRHSTAND